MEIHRIQDDIRFINQIGQTLSGEEKIKLEIALVKLAQSTQFDQLLFWGRIEGTVSNYYIALGLNYKGNFEFPHKTFFYTANLVSFVELPPINPEYKEQVETFRQLFAGQPEKILINVTEGGDGDPPAADPDANPDGAAQQKLHEDDSSVEIKAPPKNFLEVDRLSYIVLAIEADCALVPVGAMRLTPTHELRYNDSFQGLTLEEVRNIDKYQHFKAPATQEKKELIARDDALFHYNFFDPLSSDKPDGQWSVQTDSSKYNATVRNLAWPGFVGYSRANSRVFGYGYFGDGIKNIDLAFQL